MPSTFPHFYLDNLDTLYFLDQHIYLALIILDRSDIKLDLVDGGDDGGVISAEHLADLLKRQIGKLSDYVD